MIVKVNLGWLTLIAVARECDWFVPMSILLYRHKPFVILQKCFAISYSSWEIWMCNYDF